MIKSYRKLFISLSFIGLLLAPSVSLAATKFPTDTGGTLTTNLVSYYKLEDTADFYGSNNLTNNGGATFGAGKVNNGVNLVRASGQYLSIASNMGITGGNASMSLWVKIASAPSSGQYYALAVQLDGGTHTGYVIYYGNPSGTLQVRFVRVRDGVAETGVTVNTTLTTGTFYHLALTYNGTNVEGFINGVSQGTGADSGNGTSGNASRFHIGMEYNGTTHKVNGTIDEVGIWNKALSTTEISDLYNGGDGQTMCTIGSDCPSGPTNPQMQIVWIDEY